MVTPRDEFLVTKRGVTECERNPPLLATTQRRTASLIRSPVLRRISAEPPRAGFPSSSLHGLGFIPSTFHPSGTTHGRTGTIPPAPPTQLPEAPLSAASQSIRLRHRAPRRPSEARPFRSVRARDPRPERHRLGADRPRLSAGHHSLQAQPPRCLRLPRRRHRQAHPCPLRRRALAPGDAGALSPRRHDALRQPRPRLPARPQRRACSTSRAAARASPGSRSFSPTTTASGSTARGTRRRACTSSVESGRLRIPCRRVLFSRRVQPANLPIRDGSLAECAPPVRFVPGSTLG